MDNKTYNIELDIYNSCIDTSIEFVQNDTANELNIALLKDGEPFNITNCYATITFAKYDKSVVIGQPTITDFNNGKLSYVLGINDIDIAGKCLGTVEIFDENDKRLSSSQLSFNVRGELDNGEAEVSSNEVDRYAKKSYVDSHINDSAVHITTEQKTEWDNKLDDADKNIANGIAGLDSNSRIEVAQLPNNLIIDQTYESAWNTCTISYDSTTGIFTTSSPHNLNPAYPVEFRANTGVLPTGLLAYDSDIIGGTYYNVRTIPSSTTFTITSTVGGTTNFVPTSNGTIGFQFRQAGMTDFNVTGLDLQADKRYRIELSNVGLAKLEQYSTGIYLMLNNNIQYSYMGGATIYKASYSTFFGNQAKKYGLSKTTIDLSYMDDTMVNCSILNNGSSSDTKSTNTPILENVGCLVKGITANVTSIGFYIGGSEGRIRNGIRVKVWRLN